MKFGKRLAQEAARRWTSYYIDYKRLKRAIKEDLQNLDSQGKTFTQALEEELAKVSKFYGDKERELELAFASLEGNSSPVDHEITQFLHETQELQKFVALNYLAVIKASKKCNRHLKAICTEFAPTVHLDLLSTEVFFTSPRLANLSTRAEILARGRLSEKLSQDTLQDYQCPICLDVLYNPVVLTCAHRFCWGCLLAHCTTSFHRSVGNASSGAGEVKVTKHAVPDASAQLHRLQQLASAQAEQPTFYDCPVCRKPQVLDVDVLHTDVQLSEFIQGIRKREQAAAAAAIAAVESATVETSASPADAVSATAEQMPEVEPEAEEPETDMPPNLLLPPKQARHQGQMTVLLDLDGTLVSSFSPKRAPQVPPSVRTHHVGQGSQLNPHGVFVVERPGLQEFLRSLSQFSEVVIFTAGLEDYARPIIEALDPEGVYFSGCIFREGTVKTSYYQCVKDMAFVGRDLDRTVLVDDTALAFLHQPDNGIPVQQFRGEPTDKLLLDALLPFLKELQSVPDVRSVLEKRFSMATWFKRHGYPLDTILAQSADQQPRKAKKITITVDCTQHATAAAAAYIAPAGSTTAAAPPTAASSDDVSAAEAMRMGSSVKGTLLLCEFDKALINWHSGERLLEDLAPELLPMLQTLDPTATTLPVTNDLLAELSRRGVSRDKLLHSLRNQAKDIPAASTRMLKLAAQQGADIKILSDANSVFISQILSGAKATNLVSEVITNPASFQRSSFVMSDASPVGLSAMGTQAGFGSSRAAAVKPSHHQLVVTPARAPGCSCKRCPENLCKGAVVKRMRAQRKYERIVFCGNSSADVCAAMALGPRDVVLAREGGPLAQELKVAGGWDAEDGLKASVMYWDDHEQLMKLVKNYVA